MQSGHGVFVVYAFLVAPFAIVAIYLCFPYDILCTCGHLLWCQV